jgi:ABC-2 type transport system permease protein
VTAVVDALRGLLGSGASGREVLVAAGWCVGLLVVAQLLALRVHRRRVLQD